MSKNNCWPIFNHNDKIDGSTLIQNGIKTKNLWNNTFQNFQNNDISNYQNDSFKFASNAPIKCHIISIDSTNTLKTERRSTMTSPKYAIANNEDNNCADTVCLGLCLFGIVLIIVGSGLPNGWIIYVGIIFIIIFAIFIVRRKCTRETNIVADSNT